MGSQQGHPGVRVSVALHPTASQDSQTRLALLAAAEVRPDCCVALDLGEDDPRVGMIILQSRYITCICKQYSYTSATIHM